MSAAAAATRGAAAQGLDFSAAMVGIARNTYPHIVLTEGDAEDLPYPDGIFHAAVSNFGMHHYPAPKGSRRVRARADAGWSRGFYGLGDACGEHRLGGSCSTRSRATVIGRLWMHRCQEDRSTRRIIACARLRPPIWWTDRPRSFAPNGCCRNAQGLVAALSAGTVRMAALIAAQKPSALPDIIADIDAQAEASAGRIVLRCPSPRCWRAGARGCDATRVRARADAPCPTRRAGRPAHSCGRSVDRVGRPAPRAP